MAEQETRYSTLRDYLALLRRQALTIALVTIAFGGAAFGLSASQETQYRAESAVQFNDIAREAGISTTLDLPVDNSLVVRAAAEAEELVSEKTAKEVQRRLDTDVSVDSLQAAVTANVAAQTIFMEIDSTWADAEFATDIANTFAEVSVDNENEQLQRILQTSIDNLKPIAQEKLQNDSGTVNLNVFNARNQLSELTSLDNLVDEGIVKSAEVARTAEVPGSPSSPQTARNTTLGLVVGLALGLLVAFVRDSLDRRIRTTTDAHEAFGLPILGRVGKAAMGSAGAAQRTGAPGLVTPADIESFRILRSNLAALNPERPPRTVLVTSGLPQEGKSTVAASLAAASAAASQKTLLVDADLRRPVIGKRLNLRPSPGIAEYLAGTASPRSILQTVPIDMRLGGKKPTARRDDEAEPPGRSLVCITAGDAAGEPAELLASDRAHDFVDKVGRAYDLVVIDSSPLLSTADPLELMPHVDAVLICVRLTSSTGEEAKAVREAISLMPDRPIGLVVTSAGQTDGYYGYYGY